MRTRLLYKSIFMGALLVLGNCAMALDGFPREIRKTINVNQDVLFECDVDFADVSVTTWDQSTVEVIVTMEMNVKDEERANQLYDKIKVDISGGASEVRLIINVANMNTKNSECWSVKAQVKIPINGSFSGTIEFGDVSIGDMKGHCDMKLQYGDVNAQNLGSKNNKIDCSFGDAKIKSFGGGSIDAQYGQVQINRLEGDLEMDLGFGDGNLGYILPACKDLDVDAEYGNVEMKLDPAFGGSFSASSSYGSIELPAKALVTNKVEDYTSIHKSGTIGSGSSKLVLKASFGNIEITQ